MDNQENKDRNLERIKTPLFSGKELTREVFSEKEDENQKPSLYEIEDRVEQELSKNEEFQEWKERFANLPEKNIEDEKSQTRTCKVKNYYPTNATIDS